MSVKPTFILMLLLEVPSQSCMTTFFWLLLTHTFMSLVLLVLQNHSPVFLASLFKSPTKKNHTSFSESVYQSRSYHPR